MAGLSGLPAHATGGCMCGAVRYALTGAPLSTLLCHCESCRKHTGAPVVALAGYPRARMRYTSGAPKLHRSSPGVARAFCGTCGTPLTWEGDGGPQIGPLVEVLIATMDAPEDFAPACHIHHGERLAWLETADRLPRYRVWHDGPDDVPYRHGPED